MIFCYWKIHTEVNFLNLKYFKEIYLDYQLKYLDNLIGIEIGGSAHNSFGLNTINVDRHKSMSTVFKLEEEKLCGKKCLLM